MWGKETTLSLSIFWTDEASFGPYRFNYHSEETKFIGYGFRIYKLGIRYMREIEYIDINLH